MYLGKRGGLAIAGMALLAIGAGLVVSRGAGSSPVLRAVAIGSDPRAITVDEQTGRVFVLDDDGVHMLDARTGVLLRTVAGTAGADALVVDEQAGRIYLAATDAAGPTGASTGTGSISMLDARSGAVLGTVALPVAPYAMALAGRGGQLVIAGYGAPSGAGSRDVFMLAPFSDAPPRAVATGLAPRATLGLIATAVAVDQRLGHAIVGNGDGSVSLLETRGGRVLRTSALATCGGPDHLPVAVAVDEQYSRAFVTDHDGGCVDVVDTRSGALLRGVRVGGHPLDAAVDEGRGHVFVANGAGTTVSMLDAHSGRLLRTVHVGRGPQALAVDTRHGRVYVANQLSGNVSVLDARSGALLRTIPVAGNPLEVAVDERVGHVFVVSGDAVASQPDPWGWLRRWLPWLPRGRAARVAGVVTMLDAAR